MMSNNWQGKRVLILGAARQGQALSRYLVSKNAIVTLNDKNQSGQIGPEEDELRSIGIDLVLGSHPLSLLDNADVVCLSGGIPLNLSLVKEAVQRGLPLTNDSQIFMEEVKAPVIGITGSAGKTTTTSLTGLIAKDAFQSPRKAWVGGNIGLPLVEFLDEINTDDLVILELSSFQLEQMTLSPHIAAILNITPNHLDRHGSMEVYTAAKTRILSFQRQNDLAILNRDDRGSRSLTSAVRGKLFTFGMEPDDDIENGTYVENGKIYLKKTNVTQPVIDIQEIKIRGQHNLYNTLAAVAICGAAELPIESIKHGIQNFTGVEHRQEFVRQWHGITWINDSIATAPERVMAALDVFTEPLVLLLGGKDKNLPWDDLAKRIHQRVSKVILFGEAAEKIKAALGHPKAEETLKQVIKAGSFENALEKAREVAVSGEVVLLSPGCTSYDAFKDFEERGNYFKKWVKEL